MNINNLIKEAMVSYKECTEAEAKQQAKQKLDTLKLIKTVFMEYVTDKKNAKKFDEADDVSIRITKIDEAVQIKLIEDMVKERLNNVETYTNAGRDDMADKEQKELDVLETLLPKSASREDIEKFVSEKFHSGVDQKQMGLVIKEIKNAFERVDGKMASEIVKAHIS